MDDLVDKIRRGDRRSLAQAMSLVDGTGPDAEALKDWLRRWTGEVPWWGFTGPPGVGKSTLIDTLVGVLRQRDRRVGIVAVDPTSPISDGALLGDRVRMMRHAVDGDVFIRSLATRHRNGGLSDATLHCARLLELARYDPVLIETVGVGQNEVDVASVADICVVLLGPGYGDDIQLTKAGLLEIADVVVVNKCDLPEATRLLKEVREELGAAPPMNRTRPRARPAALPLKGTCNGLAALEILEIEAKFGKGVDALLEKLFELDSAARGAERRRDHRRYRLLGEIRRSAMLRYAQALDHSLGTPAGEELAAELEQGWLPLESVVARVSAAALAELEHQEGQDRRSKNG